MKTKFQYNSQYLIKDGKPWFPVMGEIHYSRYREDLWEESLRKMKAGGVTIASSYVIWIHHEEEEGKFDFTGCRNLRKYLETCKKVGIQVFLRIGPWVHGEVRNGGFPDWLQQKEKDGILLRSNDEKYLAYVKKYWEQVFAQVKGFLPEDDGPVIGIQIENEYGHVGGLRGEAGEAHMRALTELARNTGFQVPLYTATGWGGACIGDLLPVMGGYCEAPWDQRITELEPNSNYVFSHVRNDALIACDHHVEDAVTFDESKYPYLTAELGGGLQITSHRRPVAHGTDIGAMSLVKMGSGVSLLGYYMYHGGSNPEGKLSTLQESRTTGYANELPEINYDFNAPIRQYGTISNTYKEIKLLAYFLKEFGEDMAALPAEITPDKVKPGDLHTLRISCRHDERHGYVFFNNYQRRRTMDAHRGVILQGSCKEGNISFPAFDIENGDYGFFPYQMRLGDAVLRSALATPLCSLQTKQGQTFVFYGDYEPQYEWQDEKTADILHLSRTEALNAWKLTTNQDYLILSEDYVWEEDGVIRVSGKADAKIYCYPDLEREMDGFTKCGQEGRFTVYERKLSIHPAAAVCSMLSRGQTANEYEITISYPEQRNRLAGRDTLLEISYQGDSMEIFLGKKKINDYFYTGQKAVLSLGYFDFPEKLRVVLKELRTDTPVFLEQEPEYVGGRACSLEKIEVIETIRQ